MKALTWRSLRAALFWAASVLVPTAPAQDANNDLFALFNSGMQAFAAGDWAGTISAFETVIARAELTPQMEPVYFTIGAAYYNSGQFEKAATAFQTYQEKFPKGAQFTKSQFALAEAWTGAKQFDSARAVLTPLESNPSLREDVLVALARVAELEGDPQKAIPPLERLLANGISSRSAARGALQLAPLYAATGRDRKALETLLLLEKNTSLIDNIVQLNTTALQLGDSLFNQGEFESALAAYRMVRLRPQLLAFQRERIARMQDELAKLQAGLRAEPRRAPDFAGAISALRSGVAESERLLGDFEKLPDFAPGLYLRMGRSWYELGRRWQAIVLNRAIQDDYPDSPEAATALFSEAVAFADLGRLDSADQAAESYLAKHPGGSFAGNASFLRASIALQRDDLEAAERLFSGFLQSHPKSAYRETASFSLAQILFGLGRYDEAIATLGAFLQEFPASPSAEDAEYRIALAWMFSGDIETAVQKLTGYLSKYPSGRYVADARYRLAVCEFGAADHEKVIEMTRSWESDFPGHAQLPELLSLRADSLAALDRTDEALAAYRAAAESGASDEVAGYAFGEATKILRRRGDWPVISQMYESFVAANPESQLVPTAVFWIGRARAATGRPAEAIAFIAETARRHIGDPKREAVEQLLTQLAQLTAREDKRSGVPPAESASRLETLLSAPGEAPNETAEARLLFARGELLTAQKASRDDLRKQIAESFEPPVLSPLLLGQAGDYFIEVGQPDRARPFFEFLQANYPTSSVIDHAYAGLARIAYDAGDYEKALKLYTAGTERIPANLKLRELTLGKGRTLLALGRLDEAEKIFEQVASIREWRGEATAASVFSLGEVERLRGNWSKAIAYYQRVYVAYQKFLPWVAKAYLLSGEAFEKLGQSAEAANTYRELLRNERLTAFPEFAEARARLQNLPPP
ncbi:MAG: tetratricopeptide repeat protein [Terrimicrobiaceae bacterium]|nr:tetratricopeptide repeat protein [Terrimicrobiaceae bacterium]